VSAKAAIEVVAAKLVTPVIDPEYRVVLLDRKLSDHQAAGETKISPDPVSVDVYLKEETPAGYSGDAYAGGGKLKRSTADVEVFTDVACTTALAFDGSNVAALTHDQLVQGDKPQGKKLKLFLKGKKAGKFDLTLELEATDKKSIKVGDPHKQEMGVVELELEMHRYNVEIENPPPLEKLADDKKVKEGRVVHLQDGAKHGRAKLVVKKLEASQWPAGCESYDLVVEAEPVKKDGAGKVSLFETATGGSAKDKLQWQQKAVAAAQKVVWVEGTAETEQVRAIRVSLGLDRPADAHPPQQKQPKKHADWAPFTVVKLDKMAPDGQFAAASDDYKNGKYRQYVNLTAGLPAWAANKDYEVGDCRKNDSHDYEVITKGKSAASGGPTGTGADITDGGVHWKYAGINRGRTLKLRASLTKKLEKVGLRFALVPAATNGSTLPADWRPIATEHRYRDSTSAEVTVAAKGTTGKKNYTYWVVEKNAAGKVMGKGLGSTSAGNATLSATNHNEVKWNAVPGAAKYDVYLEGAGKLKADETATSFLHKGEAGDGKAVPEAPPKHILAQTDADGVAEAEVQLSLCGGDAFEAAVYLDQDPVLGPKNPVKSKAITVWRRFWYQKTYAVGFAVPDVTASHAEWRRLHVEMIKATDKPFEKATAPAGTFYPGWMITPGGADDEQGVVGSHNWVTLRGLFVADPEKPAVKAHVIACEHQWDAKGVSGIEDVWIDKSPSDEIVFAGIKVGVFKPPLDGGNVLDYGHYLEAATGVWQPLTEADVIVSKPRTEVGAVRVRLPAAATPPTAAQPVRVVIRVKKASGPWLGESSGSNILAVYRPAAADGEEGCESDYNDTVTHELGHSFKQVPEYGQQPEGTPDHPYQLRSNGNHCTYGNKKCMMYPSGPQPTAIHQFCEICSPYLRLQHMERFK